MRNNLRQYGILTISLRKSNRINSLHLYMPEQSHLSGLAHILPPQPHSSAWPQPHVGLPRHHSPFLLFQTPYNRPTPPGYTPQPQSQAEEVPRGYGDSPGSSTDNPHMVWLVASQINNFRQLGLCNSCAENLNPDSEKYPEELSTPEQVIWLQSIWPAGFRDS